MSKSYPVSPALTFKICNDPNIVKRFKESINARNELHDLLGQCPDDEKERSIYLANHRVRYCELLESIKESRDYIRGKIREQIPNKYELIEKLCIAEDVIRQLARDYDR